MDYEKLGRNRQVEADCIAEGVSIVEEYKVAFDTSSLLISSSDAKHAIVDAENSW